MPDYVFIVIEGVLAGLCALVWLLWRHADHQRRRLAALETEQGLLRKKLDAAVEDLNRRLERAERLPPRPARPAPVATAGRLPRRAVELLEKVRRLRETPESVEVR